MFCRVLVDSKLYMVYLNEMSFIQKTLERSEIEKPVLVKAVWPSVPLDMKLYLHVFQF